VFALPGVLLLVVFLLARPLDLFPDLQGGPVLYVLAALALFGVYADVRLRLTELRVPRHFGWALAFTAWCVVSAAICAPETLVKTILSLTIAFLVYGVLATGIQTFKGLQVIAGGMLAVALFIGALCVHMAQQPTQCVAYLPGETTALDQVGTVITAGMGHPDGRPCKKPEQCIEGGDRANLYTCESAGWFGLTSVKGRVRYTGTLHDPNEVALYVSACLPFAFAFYRRRRTLWRGALAVSSTALVGATVYYTHSRGGLLVLLTVLGFYVLQRVGLKRALILAIPAGVVLVSLMLTSGGGARADAEDSTLKRLQCMWSGLQMLRHSPLYGVGFNQFTEHHDQTAHNSYILAAAELGVPGLLLWAMTFYLVGKSLVVALRTCPQPEAEVARIWGGALMASLLGITVGIFFLSFTYHYVLWVFFGLAGAFASAVRVHERRFTVTVGLRDMVLVASAASALMVGVFLYILAKRL
jgi:O-antigen ligase